jgi:hypothetical protein
MADCVSALPTVVGWASRSNAAFDGSQVYRLGIIESEVWDEIQSDPE